MNIDPNRRGAKPTMDVEDLYWTPQEYAFDLIATTFGITDDALDEMDPERRRYMAALAETAALFVVTCPDQTIDMISAEELAELNAAAHDSDTMTPIMYLQSLTIFAQQEKGRLRPEPATPGTALAYFSNALAAFKAL